MRVSTLRPLTVLAVVAALVATLAAVAVGRAQTAGASPDHRPYVHGTSTVPTYSYANAIHQTVYVRAPFDSDGDGKDDRVAVDIIRPAEAARQHVKVPVIMDASPYFTCCGRGNESELKTYQADGTIAKLPLFYDNYFVPRGYAVAGVDLVGTARSTGCGDVGGRYEVLGAKAAIDWFNGRVPGYDSAGDRVTANWTTGKVGMIGKSWDGSIANGVAATGVRGLSTVVPISAISSWYDYTRFGGVLRSTDYVDYLATYTGGRPKGVCDSRYAAEQAASDDATGNFNAFWQARDYRPDASKVRASVFLVHGLNDQNVTTNQFGQWWPRLARNGVPRKIWLSQDGHVDPFDYRRGVWVRTLHQWFDRWLQGLPNGIMNKPQADVQRADGTWTTQASWPGLTATFGTSLSRLGGSAPRTFTDAPSLTEDQAVASPQSSVAGRAVFESGALTRAVHIAGSPSVTLRIKVDRPTTELSARLVDYGTQRRVDYLSPGEGISTLTTQSCWGESTAVDDACYFDTAQDYVTSDTDIITRGWLDAAHHTSLRRTTPLTPGRWYTITVPIDTTDAVFAKGHRVALVLTQSDNEYTSPTPTGATVTVDPTRSALSLPFVFGGKGRVTGLPAGSDKPATTGRAPAVVAHARIARPRQVPLG
ncbi:Xaa-Pro dipeptidyl-peptidase [uncultured Jatrophihabitans sp.]|uniref:Xaa-Pro dipeptidyl-peptidase n=1 Tax=uncultured Jatrophihabitans sp. TaxID=1610747 RepID=UPI0035CC8775